MTDHSEHSRSTQYKKNSLTLIGAISMGTGVMIGAGILALTGQIAELAGSLFPLAFLAAAVVTAFSAYSYIKMSNAYPSAGGIGMFLQKAYGHGTVTAGGALLMYFSMVINESLVARTFGTYTMQLFDAEPAGWAVTALGVGVLVFAFLLNISGNRLIGGFSLFMAFIKIGGIVVFAAGGLWIAGISLESVLPKPAPDASITGFLAAMALAILAFKGFTTITNSGSEIVDPHKNVGRAIIISILICIVIYVLVALAVAGNLTLAEIIAAKDFALAKAARPAFGSYGLWFTVGLAIVATISGLIASVFAVSRMLAMLTDMKLVPHSHFGMPGDIQKHTLVYTVVIAIFLTIFFDLSRIASLGAIFYIIMDIAVHWGVFRYLREEIGANGFVVMAAIVFDVVVLGAFLIVKASSDMMVIYAALIGVTVIFTGERFFLKWYEDEEN
ncbi:APC family permease [Sneathiella sp.]|jgi:amino acid transporter|uniref:APC family permease n=1 Tax=Sneathiella sp. TaxID=1964365 RepID=UPI000C44F68E|nr:APC family permease [Sneathiella sp.]MAL79537.1 amino acid permease [Sneathiella sp.]MAZ03917.1 amino acid permease [Sneathiella sp.]|tara:strand:- start:19761 stop:21089 length:1329 start_codon:yes stop_codon:yes gene_type:complete